MRALILAHISSGPATMRPVPNARKYFSIPKRTYHLAKPRYHFAKQSRLDYRPNVANHYAVLEEFAIDGMPVFDT